MSDEPNSPPTRAEGLDINLVDDGCVVYQNSHDRVHYLNPTAGLLLELCNGVLGASELAQQIGRAWRLPAPPYDDVVDGLRELRALELIR